VRPVREDERTADDRPGQAALLDQAGLRAVVPHDRRHHGAQKNARGPLEKVRPVGAVDDCGRGQHDKPVEGLLSASR